MAPHISMGSSTSYKCLIIITLQNVLGRAFFLFLFLPNPVAWDRDTEEPVPIRNYLKLAVSLKKLCALMKGCAGLLMPQSQDGREWHFGCPKQHKRQGTKQMSCFFHSYWEAVINIFNLGYGNLCQDTQAYHNEENLKSCPQIQPGKCIQHIFFHWRTSDRFSVDED